MSSAATPPVTSSEQKPTMSVSAKPTNASYIQHVESFNKKLKILTLDMYNRFKSDAMIWRAKERVMASIAIDPLYIIDVIGTYLYSFRVQIYGKNAAFFIEQEYEKEFRESVDPSKVDMVRYIMPKLKSVWGSLDATSKAQYEQIVIDLLDDYVEYLSELKLGE
jgi:hypothetical protein